jgi:hypothetical protein
VVAMEMFGYGAPKLEFSYNGTLCRCLCLEIHNLVS